MRNFIVAFMLVILLSSIMFVILKPMQSTKINIQNKEKTNVEKLLTEPTTQTSSNPQEMTAKEKKETIEQILENFNNSNDNKLPVKEIKEEQPKNKQNITDNKQQISEKEINKTEVNNNYKNIQEELSRKYGNDPNAEISQEDFQNFMLKIIEASQQQQ